MLYELGIWREEDEEKYVKEIDAKIEEIVEAKGRVNKKDRFKRKKESVDTDLD